MLQTKLISLCVLATVLVGACVDPDPELEGTEQDIFVEEILSQIPNNIPFPNAHGFAATFSTAGRVSFENAFFTPQGTNGRHCGTCHAPEVGWSINGAAITVLFLATGGSHPIFRGHLDTDTPTAPWATIEDRWKATTMLRQGKFARKIGLPATRDYDLVDVNDPFGVSTPTTLFWFRRPMPSANLRNHIVHVTLRCDFLLDCHGNAVDGNHIGGQRPTGDGVAGGTFESWFMVVSDEAYEQHKQAAQEALAAQTT